MKISVWRCHKKNETNKNNPQLLGHVIFIYVAGSIQVPFD